MNKFNVFINKKTISIQDRGFNFGDGVFETILVRENKPLWLRKHFQRMAYGCKSLQIDVPPLSLIKECSTEAISNTRNCILKKGRLVKIKKCKEDWCKINTDEFKGWVKKESLWGFL